MPRGQPGAVSSASRGRRLTGKPVTESNLILCVRAKIRRYLEPDFRCLRCKHGGSRASARTRYLEHCQRRELARNPLSLPLLGVCGCVRNAPRGHVNAADHLVSGTFSKRAPDNRRSACRAKRDSTTRSGADLDDRRGRRRPVMPDSDRCVLAHSYAGLNIADGGEGRRFRLAVVSEARKLPGSVGLIRTEVAYARAYAPSGVPWLWRRPVLRSPAKGKRRVQGPRVLDCCGGECQLAKNSEANSASAVGSTARCQCAVILPSRRW